MAEAQLARVQHELEEMMQSLERDHIRKLQSQVFRCSAECCERMTDSTRQVYECIERCHTPLVKSQALVTNELEQFQNRLTRCMTHCNDKATDLVNSGAQKPAVGALIDKCVSRCVDDHLQRLPSITHQLRKKLESIPQ